MEGNGGFFFLMVGMVFVGFNEALPLWKGMDEMLVQLWDQSGAASMRPFLYGREWLNYHPCLR